MTEPLWITPVVEESRLSSGETVFVASWREMPGVVCEGESADAAVAELLGVAQSVRERLGAPMLGLVTDFAEEWSWEMHPGASYSTAASGGRPKTAGAANLQAV